MSLSRPRAVHTSTPPPPGQFGVGFYAAFLVADRVSVWSRPRGAPRGAPAHVWESDARGQ